MLNARLHIHQSKFVFRQPQVCDKLLNNIVHRTGAALVGLMNLAAGHEHQAILFAAVPFRDVWKRPGTVKEFVSKIGEHHILQHVLLAAEKRGEVLGQLHPKLAVQAIVGFIRINDQHPLSSAGQCLCQQSGGGAFSAAAFSADRYFHSGSSIRS